MHQSSGSRFTPSRSSWHCGVMVEPDPSASAAGCVFLDSSGRVLLVKPAYKEPWEIPGAIRKHSPLAHVGNVKTPTLVLHARDDRRCPVAMGRMFYQALLDRKVPTQMVIYPNEGHGIRQPRHQEDALRRTLAWFAEHDKKK